MRIALPRFSGVHRLHVFQAVQPAKAMSWSSVSGAVCAVLLSLSLVPVTTYAQSFDTAAEQAYVVDLSTDTVLLEKAEDTPMPPSSMSKLMTVYVAFQRLKEGSLSLDLPVTASRDVWERWRLKGSTMFLNAGQSVTIDQLLSGIIVQSGNDACAWLAEAIAGSEEAYVILMNQAAEEIGMTGSNFTNVNGWPDPAQYVTAKDLGLLAKALIEDFPDYYERFAQRRFEFGDASSNYNNRNPILGRVRGADGLKTGHTEAAGYGLVGSAVRGDRRLVVVVNGLDSESARRSESARLFEWGFANFRGYDLLKAGDVVANAPVWMGTQGSVALAIAQDVTATLSRQARLNLMLKVRYEGPVQAPIAAGDVVGELDVSGPDGVLYSAPVVAAHDVAKVSGMAKIGAALDHLIFGSAAASPQSASAQPSSR